jgi:peptide subunit release factor 1 (eRF1)
VQRALAAVVSALQRLQGRLPGTGAVVLASAHSGAVVVLPPTPVAATVYTCGSRYQLDDLWALVARRHDPPTALILTDGSECRGYALTSVADARRVFDIESMASGRTRRGGSSAARIARIRDDQEGCFHKRVADAAAQAWLDADGRPTLRAVVIAGPAGSKSAVADRLCGALRACLLPLLTTATLDVHVAWHASEGIRAWANDGRVRALDARVQALRETDPDLLVWGKDEICTAARSGVLEVGLVHCLTDYAALQATTAVVPLVPWVGVSMDVGILRYHCGDMRALAA